MLLRFTSCCITFYRKSGCAKGQKNIVKKITQLRRKKLCVNVVTCYKKKVYDRASLLKWLPLLMACMLGGPNLFLCMYDLWRIYACMICGGWEFSYGKKLEFLKVARINMIYSKYWLEWRLVSFIEIQYKIEVRSNWHLIRKVQWKPPDILIDSVFPYCFGWLTWRIEGTRRRPDDKSLHKTS